MGKMERIISILKEIQPIGEFEADTMLFESGYVDSLVIFERLLPRLEEIYGIQIEPMELIRQKQLENMWKERCRNYESRVYFL